jgi:hypothetical protein
MTIMDLGAIDRLQIYHYFGRFLAE